MAYLETRLRRAARGLFWFSIYMAITLAPLTVAFVYRDHPRRDFWTEFSVALGFVALSMLGLQFLVTARFRHIAAPYGIDILLRFHRQISMLILGLAASHPAILFVTRPETLSLLNILDAPWRARAAVTGLVAMILLVALSVWRKKLHFDYQAWRLTHGVLAIAAIAFVLVHIQLVGWYVDLPWKRALWAAIVVMVVALLVYVRLVRPLLLRRRPYVVREVRPERGRTFTLVLEPLRHSAMRFRPGQFAWLTLDQSPWLLEDHPFSFSSSALDRESLSMTIKELGDFTSAIGDVPAGTRAYLEGPHGAFSIDRYDGPGYVFVAGGVGITPIMSMLRTLVDRHDDREHLLLYSGRSLEELTFKEDLDELARRLRLEIVYVLSRPREGWQGVKGRITYDLLSSHIRGDRAEYHYFVCGPAPMMDDIETKLLRAGVPPGHIASERFNLV